MEDAHCCNLEVVGSSQVIPIRKGGKKKRKTKNLPVDESKHGFFSVGVPLVNHNCFIVLVGMVCCSS